MVNWGACHCWVPCVVKMVVDSILPHVESGPNDHRKDAPPFKSPTVGLPPLKTPVVLSIEHLEAHQLKLTGIFTSFGMLNETENYDKNESYSNAN